MKREKKLANGLERLFSSKKPVVEAATVENTSVQPQVTPPPPAVVEQGKKPAVVKKVRVQKPLVEMEPAPLADTAPVKEEPSMQVVESKPKAAFETAIPAPVSQPVVAEKPVESSSPTPVENKKGKAIYESDEHIVVFSLDHEQYGINISLVESIIKIQGITVVPGAPDAIEGVTNLRGRVLPVINLHHKLKLPERTITPRSRIIVAALNDLSAGMVVDDVIAVIQVPAADIDLPSPIIASSIDRAFIKGIARLEDGMVIIIDLQQLLSGMDRRGYAE